MTHATDHYDRVVERANALLAEIGALREGEPPLVTRHAETGGTLVSTDLQYEPSTTPGMMRPRALSPDALVSATAEEARWFLRSARDYNEDRSPANWQRVQSDAVSLAGRQLAAGRGR